MSALLDICGIILLVVAFGLLLLLIFGVKVEE